MGDDLLLGQLAISLGRLASEAMRTIEPGPQIIRDGEPGRLDVRASVGRMQEPRKLTLSVLPLAANGLIEGSPAPVLPGTSYLMRQLDLPRRVMLPLMASSSSAARS
jgi:hypothetical protein